MKLYRALPQDYEDMVLLWPNCGFADPTDAADAFWRAYPHAPDDEFLTDYIEGICHRGRCPTPRLTAPSPVTGSASLRAIATALLRVETMPARAPYRRLTAATGAARRARLDSGAARRALGGDAGGHLAYRERADRSALVDRPAACHGVVEDRSEAGRTGRRRNPPARRGERWAAPSLTLPITH